jgi:hypothetical protein
MYLAAVAVLPVGFFRTPKEDRGSVRNTQLEH